MIGQKKLNFIIKLVILNILISVNIYSKEIKLSVASSMSGVINEIITEYKKEKKVNFLVNTGGSGILKKQIEDGAQVDIVFFADTENMDQLKRADLVEFIPEQIVIYNSLVLAGRENINSLDELKGKKVGIADPKTVPAGRYAKDYLERGKKFEIIETDIIYGKDVRSISNYLELGEIDYGFIYRTELNRLNGIKEVYELNSRPGTEVKYSFGVLTNRGTDEVLAFYNYLGSEKAISILEKAGYRVEKK